MAAADVDTALLSNFCAVPQPTIQKLIEEPTHDLAVAVLNAVLVKAQDHDRLKSERLRLDVELENAIRGGDARARTLKESEERALQQVEDLRVKLSEEERAHADLADQLQNLQSSTSKSSADSQMLESQVAKLEQSNRDTLSLLNSKTEAYDKLTEEVTAAQQKSLGLRREIGALEERNQTAENSLSNAKFRESALQSEVDLLKRNNEWLESELKTKAAEYSKYRKEKSARITELQRANEDATQNIESLQRTENGLRRQLDEVGQKADDAFAKIQQIQEESARTEEDFKSELENAKRLTELQKQSSDTARRRVQELEDSVEQTEDNAREEISVLQAELETERQGREGAEQRIEQLEAEIEKLGSGTGAPATPGSRVNGHPASASASPAAARSRGGLTFTQLYTEHSNIKAELDEERRKHGKVREAFDEMLRELEQKEPEMQENQLERDRLESEVAQLSAFLETARQEKDAARKEVRRFQGQVESAERKAKVLEQQLRDLSVQVKVLLVEVQIREDGVQFSAAERSELQRAARGEGDSTALEGMSDTARFISERLVSFQNAFELQEKNMELTKIVREIGDRREEEEARTKLSEQQSAEGKEELEALREKLERYKDEMQALVTQSQSYIRERDMFRRMLSHRGKIPPGTDMAAMFGSSLNGPGTPRTPRTGQSSPDPEQSPVAKELSTHVKLLKELQSHFDAYRQEAATDYKAIKAQADGLTKDKNQLQGELAKATSQLSLAQERYQMLQSNYDLLKSESAEMQKRSDFLAETAAKQDIRTQQVAEEVVEAKSLADSLRTENANLKAEKDLWKRIEARLSEDNHSLVEERTRLNKMIVDMQSLSNERELSDAESRRRMQSQVDSTELELHSVKRKLEEEIESNKNATLRREYEQEQSRTRIDDLVKSLSNVKEEFVAAKTTRDQLQTRLEELKIELRTAEERAQALQPRPTPRPSTSTTEAHTSEAPEDGLSREAELAIQVADLKRDLDLSKAELESAKAQVEQYRAISQSAEEELQSINETHDQFKQESEKDLSEKDAKIVDYEQRLNDALAELTTTNGQLSELRASAADAANRLDQQRASFETEVAQIKDECERYKETSNFHREDLKVQADVAQQAQQSYETELVKHAEAAKELQRVRSELNEIKLEVSQAKADAEAARAIQGQSEESWTSTREHYERELTEMRTRRDDVDAQNKILHNQLESVSAQIAALQQKRGSGDDGDDLQTASSSGVQNLQEVIKYLRREKEIVDVQYELSVQESKRLRQQLDYSQSQLDEARLRLDQERKRQADKEQSSVSHNKLMETINELNVFRESSVTLRSEARQAQAQLAEKSKQVEELTAQIEPLQTSVRELENQRDTIQGEMKLLEEDRNRWQQRAQNILQKYDRIDPADLENLKEQIAKLETERDTAASEKQSLQERIDGIEDEIQQARDQARTELRDKLSVQFKTRSKELSTQINAAKAESQALREQLDAVNTELEAVKRARDDALGQVQALSSNQGDAQMQDADQVPTTGDEAHRAIQERLAAAEASAAQRLAELETAKSEAAELKDQITQLQSTAQELEGTLKTVNEELSSLRGLKEDGDIPADVEKLKEELSASQTELETLRSQASLKISTEPTDSSGNIEGRVAEIRAELEASQKTKVEQLEEQYKQRADNMRKQLSTKLTEGKAAYREQVGKEHEAAIQELQKQLDEAKSAQTQPRDLGADSAPVATGAPPASENSFNEDSTVKVKLETSTPPEQWTSGQVQSFLANNAEVKSIVARNLKTKLEQEITKLKTQAEKDMAEKLEESRQAAEKAKQQAVFMEGKKSSVRISMAEGKLRASTAKLDVVEKAAVETPQRPVGEVWDIAKNAKAPPQPASQPPPSPAAGQAQGTVAPTPVRRPSAAQKPVDPTSVQPDTSNEPAPLVVESPKPVEGESGQAQTDAKESTTAAKPTSIATQGQGTGPAALRGLVSQGSSIPRGGAGGSIRGAPTRGGRGGQTVAAPTESSAAAAAPQATGHSARGGTASNLPRGGGRGSVRGRGQGGTSQQQGDGNSGRGGAQAMNAGARQFVPGNKRPRQDSTGGGGGGGGDTGNKRPRGGQQGN